MAHKTRPETIHRVPPGWSIERLPPYSIIEHGGHLYVKIGGGDWSPLLDWLGGLGVMSGAEMSKRVGAARVRLVSIGEPGE